MEDAHVDPPRVLIPAAPLNRVCIADILPNKIEAHVEGRVSSKTSLRQRSRDDESLTVFSFVLQDATGRINVTAWDDVATRVYDSVRVGACLRFTMLRSKDAAPGSQQYRVADHASELTLTTWSTVNVLDDDSHPDLQSDILTIVQLRGKDPNATVDLIAIVFEVGPLQNIACQDGRLRKKRQVTLVDESLHMVSLGLWPEFTEVLNDCTGRAVLFQNLQLREYNGRTMLSTTTNSIINVNSTHETVQHLQTWFAATGLAHTYAELQN